MKRKECEHGISRKILCNACIDEFFAGFHIMPQEGGGLDMEERDRPMTDHAEAAAYGLMAIVRKLEDGTPPEDLGGDVILLGRLMARRT